MTSRGADWNARIARFARSSWVRLLDLLAPRYCAACDGVVQADPWCGECCVAYQALSPPPRAELDGAPLLAAGRYAEPLSTAIRQLKYHRRPELARELVALLPLTDLERVVAARAERRMVMVPVPLHPSRLVGRGFNQSALIAAELSARVDIAFEPRALRRLRATEAQASTVREQRERNVASAFAPRSGELAGASVILVDDVVTSGATLGACRTAVREAGGHVAAYVVIADARTAGTSAPELSCPPEPKTARAGKSAAPPQPPPPEPWRPVT